MNLKVRSRVAVVLAFLMQIFSCEHSNPSKQKLNPSNHSNKIYTSDLKLIVYNPKIRIHHPYLSLQVRFDNSFQMLNQVDSIQLNEEDFYFINLKGQDTTKLEFYGKQILSKNNRNVFLKYQFDTYDLLAIFYKSYFLIDSCNFYYKDIKIFTENKDIKLEMLLSPPLKTLEIENTDKR